MKKYLFSLVGLFFLGNSYGGTISDVPAIGHIPVIVEMPYVDVELAFTDTGSPIGFDNAGDTFYLQGDSVWLTNSNMVGSLLTFDLTPMPDGLKVVGGPTLDNGAKQAYLFEYTYNGGEDRQEYWHYLPVVNAVQGVPEPSAALLGLVGALGLGLFRKR